MLSIFTLVQVRQQTKQKARAKEKETAARELWTTTGGEKAKNQMKYNENERKKQQTFLLYSVSRNVTFVSPIYRWAG